MAIKLDTSEGTRNVKAQAMKERDLKFKLVRIAAVALTVVSVGYSAYNGFRGYQEMSESDAKIAELNVAYDRIKAEAALWHEQNDEKLPSDETGVTIRTQEMFSAKTAGVEVAAIQTDFANENLISPQQQARLQELTNSKNCWFGTQTKKLDASDPNAVILNWEFFTFYDAQKPEYDCVWGCWATKASDSSSRYLVAMAFGRYNGNTNTFKISGGDTYITSFGEMLSKYGAIDSKDGSGGSQTTTDVLDMAGELAGDQPAGDPDATADGDAATDGTEDIDSSDGDGQAASEPSTGQPGDAIVTDDEGQISTAGTSNAD